MNSDRIAPSFNMAFEAFQGLLFGYPDPLITRETINGIPYASALLKIGKGSNGLIILESVSGNQYTWVSRDKVFLVTVGGRIQKTVGLPNNLTDLRSLKQTFEDLIEEPNGVYNYFAYYSYEQPNLTDLKVNVSLVNKGTQEVEILGEVRNLILFEEKISNDVIRWSETNLYWVDPKDYFVWKSVQHISPKLPAFKLQITKRPGV